MDQVVAAAAAKRRDARPHALLDALQRDGVNIIAEFKRRSPSKGVIRTEATPQSIASSYVAGGAVGISVLTEQDYFDGSTEDLLAVKRAIPGIPVLRKDFVFDEYQVYETAAMGADAVLLIVAALDDETLRRLRVLAEDVLGIDALIEVHTAVEMKLAVECGAILIGVNNRNLHTFNVSLETSLSLASGVPSNATLISESGLHSSADVERLRDVGYRGFLIGESLMRAANPEQSLRSLIAGSTG
jgi:indole-3-glycerol phosphate synthase